MERKPLWTGRQWIVSRNVIEAPSHGGYWINRDRIGELRGNGLLNLPMHMAEKDWVDFADFEQAFRFAAKDSISRELVDRSFLAGYRERARNERFEEKLRAKHGDKFFYSAAELTALLADE
jgi:hypothetical protein